MRAVLVWGGVAVATYVLFQVVYAREDKCTNAEAAFMIAKRFTVDREGLTVDDQPDFPWETPEMVRYQGSCTHGVWSYFERIIGGERHRIGYAASVHFDRLSNKWSLLDWRQTGDRVIQ